MYLAAANALARARGTYLFARTASQVPLSFNVARRVHLQLQRNATSRAKARSSRQDLDEEPQSEASLLRELYSDARKLCSKLPLERALTDVRDLLHTPKIASLRPDERLLTIMLGRNTYHLSDIDRIAEVLSMTPHEKMWTTAIIHAVTAFDMDEALRLYDEAWARGTPPLNGAAQAIIRGLVYPQNGGTFADTDDILQAVSILKRQMQKPALKTDNDPPVNMARALLLTAIVGNPTIPDRIRLIEDILSAFRERGWQLERGARRVSSLLHSIYLAPSHSAAVDLVAEQEGLSQHDYRSLLTYIASIKFDAESFMSRDDLLRFVGIAEAHDMGRLTLFREYFTALRDVFLPDHPQPQLLATVRDVEQDALEKYGVADVTQYEQFNTALLSLYARLAGSGDVLPDLHRCWSRIAVPGQRINDRALCVALRVFPPGDVREIWAHRVNIGGALSLKLWANWVQALCRMGEVDEAFDVFQERLGDRHPGANAGGALFASARSEEEQQRWAEEFPRTWSSPRTQRLLRLRKTLPTA